MEQWEIEARNTVKLKDFYYNKLDFCGCGRPDCTLEFIKKLLNIIKQKTDRRSEPNYNCDESWDKHQNNLIETFEFKAEKELSDIQDGIVQFVMYYLDRIGVLEHGGGIGGAWLSDYGKELLEILNYFDDLEYVLD